MVRVLDLKLASCGFDCWPLCPQLTSLGKLFTHACISKQYNLALGLKTVVPCCWEGLASHWWFDGFTVTVLSSCGAGIVVHLLETQAMLMLITVLSSCGVGIVVHLLETQAMSMLITVLSSCGVGIVVHLLETQAMSMLITVLSSCGVGIVVHLLETQAMSMLITVLSSCGVGIVGHLLETQAMLELSQRNVDIYVTLHRPSCLTFCALLAGCLPEYVTHILWWQSSFSCYVVVWNIYFIGTIFWILFLSVCVI